MYREVLDPWFAGPVEESRLASARSRVFNVQQKAEETPMRLVI
jgi:hypothetical protein